MNEISPRILQICSYYVTSRLYQNLFNSLESLDLDEDIYVFTHKEPDVMVKEPNVLLSRCFRNWERYFFPLKHKRVLKDIRIQLDIERYSILHAHSLFSNGYIAYRLKREFGIPYVVAVRNTDVNLFFRKMIHMRRLGRKILRNADRVVFISKPYRDHTINRFVHGKDRDAIRCKSIVIPNGIDKFWLENRPEEKPSPNSNGVKILYVGLINRNKNIETTIHACEILLREGFRVNYRIVGRMVENEYEKLFLKHPFIDYVPHCSKEELIGYYREADVFVMPSRHETFGLVYAEAMTQGVPIIFSRGQGFDGQFGEGEVGYSVQYDSSDEIADRVKDVLRNYTSLSLNCRQKSSRFDWNQIADQYLELYSEVGT